MFWGGRACEPGRISLKTWPWPAYRYRFGKGVNRSTTVCTGRQFQTLRNAGLLHHDVYPGNVRQPIYSVVYPSALYLIHLVPTTPPKAGYNKDALPSIMPPSFLTWVFLSPPAPLPSIVPSSY